jgi:signal transduction histidine kinase
VAYLLFSTFRRAEQNQVWAGMAKETAHQLGTPISSLMAWMEILKSENVNLTSIDEMNKDVLRLETITERFSKIGSSTKLEKVNLVLVVKENVEYLKNRISKKINVKITSSQNNIIILGDKSLIQWVIENLTKNAVDAMKGAGDLTFSFKIEKRIAILDVSDTGKGIEKLKTVFEPGYTTKKRGWGLGLSLAKRIIEEQHNGEIIILQSELGLGTTFRIKIPLA